MMPSSDFCRRCASTHEAAITIESVFVFRALPPTTAAGACGGETACSTCHIILDKKYFDLLPEMEEARAVFCLLAIHAAVDGVPLTMRASLSMASPSLS